MTDSISGGGGYYIYMLIKSIPEAVRKIIVDAKDSAHEKISTGVAGVARKAQELSSTVQGRVEPALRTVSEELPGTIQAASSKVGEVAGGAKSTIISHWEWVKKEVERRMK